LRASKSYRLKLSFFACDNERTFPVVAPIHPKAMPVMLTDHEERDF
jgi:hypothetical protein